MLFASNPSQEVDVTRDYVECSEVAGKTIKALKVYEDSVDGYEALIEFTDGTSFSYAVGHQTDGKSDLISGRCRNSSDHPRLQRIGNLRSAEVRYSQME
jgi:hypothetical protein